MKDTIFNNLIAGELDFDLTGEGKLSEWDLKVAVVGLLYSVVQSDQKVADVELQKLREILKDNYRLGAEEVEELILMGNKLYSSNENFERFCDVLKESFSEIQREKVYAFGWKLICADNVIEESERAFAEILREKLGIPVERANEIKDLVIRLSQIASAE